MTRKILLLLLLAFSPVVLFAVSYNTVSVSPTATLIIPASRGRAGWMLCNVSTSTIYIGGDANITASNAIPLLTNEKLLADGDTLWRGTIYGIVASGGSMELRYLEWNVADISQ